MVIQLLCNIIMQQLETEIVNSKGHQKARLKINVLGALFFIFFLSPLGLLKLDLFEIHIALLIVSLIIGIISGLIMIEQALSLNKYRNLGKLIFDSESFTVKAKQNKEKVFNVKDCQNIQLTIYNPKNKVKWVREMKNDGANNWISFIHNEKQVLIEFFLRNEKDDELFLKVYESWKVLNAKVELTKNNTSFLNQLSKFDKDYITDIIFDKIS